MIRLKKPKIPLDIPYRVLYSKGMRNKRTVFSRSFANSVGNLRTVYVKLDGQLDGGCYLYSFEGGEWKRSEALGERHGLRYSSDRLLSDAKDSVKVSERVLRNSLI